MAGGGKKRKHVATGKPRGGRQVPGPGKRIGRPPKAQKQALLSGDLALQVEKRKPGRPREPGPRDEDGRLLTPDHGSVSLDKMAEAGFEPTPAVDVGYDGPPRRWSDDPFFNELYELYAHASREAQREADRMADLEHHDADVLRVLREDAYEAERRRLGLPTRKELEERRRERALKGDDLPADYDSRKRWL